MDIGVDIDRENIIEQCIDESRSRTLSRLADKIGVHVSTVHDWKVKNRVPLDKVPIVSEVTGIPRHIIRPDRPDLFPPPDGGSNAGS